MCPFIYLFFISSVFQSVKSLETHKDVALYNDNFKTMKKRNNIKKTGIHKLVCFQNSLLLLSYIMHNLRTSKIYSFFSFIIFQLSFQGVPSVSHVIYFYPFKTSPPFLSSSHLFHEDHLMICPNFSHMRK